MTYGLIIAVVGMIVFIGSIAYLLNGLSKS